MSEALWSQELGKGYDWCADVPGTLWRNLEPEQQAELTEDVYDSDFFDRDTSNPNRGKFIVDNDDCDGERVGEDLTAYAKVAVEQIRAGRGIP